LTELKVLSADVAAKVRITHRAVEPVIKAAAEIALHGVGVASAPARQQHTTDISLEVAIGVFEEEHVTGFRHHDAAVHEHQRSREVQFVGEDRELVGLAVAVSVLANFDVGLARLAFVYKTVRIVPRLDYPRAP